MNKATKATIASGFAAAALLAACEVEDNGELHDDNHIDDSVIDDGVEGDM